MIKLKDKTFLITGATSDVGRSLVMNLSRLGADVALLDKNPEKAQRIVNEISESREIKEEYGRAIYIEADLTKASEAKEAVSKTVESFGGLDVLISGLCTSTIAMINSPEYLSVFDRLLEVNTKSAVYTTEAAVPFMRSRKRGKIIYLISDMVRWGSEGESLSSVTRGGLIYYARALARELAGNNIAVNCVTMGPTEDYLMSRDPKASSIKAAETKLMEVMPMGRTLRGDEIAQVITFLASPQADAVTGQTWAVNGGLTMF